MKSLLIFVVLSAYAGACAASEQGSDNGLGAVSDLGGVNDVDIINDPDIEQKVYWIDTRTAEEFAAGHLDDAVLIPFDVIDQKITSLTDNKNADIRVYCRSGRRSGIAKETLNTLGYSNVTNEGGYKEIMAR